MTNVLPITGCHQIIYSYPVLGRVPLRMPDRLVSLCLLIFRLDVSSPPLTSPGVPLRATVTYGTPSRPYFRRYRTSSWTNPDTECPFHPQLVLFSSSFLWDPSPVSDSVLVLLSSVHVPHTSFDNYVRQSTTTLQYTLRPSPLPSVHYLPK